MSFYLISYFTLNIMQVCWLFGDVWCLPAAGFKHDHKTYFIDFYRYFIYILLIVYYFITVLQEHSIYSSISIIGWMWQSVFMFFSLVHLFYCWSYFRGNSCQTQTVHKNWTRVRRLLDVFTGSLVFSFSSLLVRTFFRFYWSHLVSLRPWIYSRTFNLLRALR